MSSGPWNNWYHCVGSTYGTWLRGDPRGWRARYHREHVEGDYKQPPPEGAYIAVEQTSRQLMKRPAVRLNPDHRICLCQAMAEKLQARDVELIDLCVAKMHFHLLARFTPAPYATVPGLVRGNRLADGRDPAPRHLLGLAKKHSSHVLNETFGKPFAGGVWAARGKVLPVHGRSHQLAVAGYIRDHVTDGAAVWSML